MNWGAMKYLPPYSMHYPLPGKLEIRVKPRYAFPAVVLIFMLPQIILYLWSYDTFTAVWRVLLSPFGGGFADSKSRDVYTVFPLLVVLAVIALVAAHQLYKRHGLIEVTRKGVRIVENPHFGPRGESFIAHQDIAELRDEVFYVRTEEAGMKLILHKPSGVQIELIKIWGSDRSSARDYQVLSNEIRHVLGALGT